MAKKFFLKHKGFLSYAFLSYGEKGLIFCFPLLLLWLTKNQTAYNSVEYVFALSGVLALFLDGGLRIYLLHAYRQSEHSMEVVRRAFSCLRMLVLIYLCFAIVTWMILWVLSSDFLFEFSNVAARALFLVTVTFLAVFYRIKDNPVQVFYYSIPVYVSGLVILYFASGLPGNQALTVAVMVPHLIAILVVMVFTKNNKAERLSAIKNELRKSLIYSWPVLVSVAVTMMMASFGRIYAYGHLDEQEMFALSFVQRLALVVQLTHVAITGYFAKRLFMSDDRSYHVGMVFKYLVSLLSAAVLSYCLMNLIGRFGIPTPPNVGGLFLIMSIYIILWCFAAYLEIYINRADRNVSILYGTVLSLLVYVGVLYFVDVEILIRFAIAMASSSGFYLLYMVKSLISLKVNHE